jgi:hypothetical protein
LSPNRQRDQGCSSGLQTEASPVANKNDLLDGMADIVFSEIELPPTDVDWKTAMRQRAISTREALGRHR